MKQDEITCQEGWTAFVNLPIWCKTEEKLTDDSTPQLFQIGQLRALHDALNSVIQSLANICLLDMRCVTSDMNCFVPRFSFASYMESLLELEDLLARERRNITNRTYHRCPLESAQMPFHPYALKRTLHDTKEKLTSNSVPVEELTKHSVLPLLPIFSTFPTVTVHPGNEI